MLQLGLGVTIEKSQRQTDENRKTAVFIARVAPATNITIVINNAIFLLNKKTV